MNLVEGILKERDRLVEMKQQMGSVYDLPELFFWRAMWEQAMNKATKAIAGELEITDMLAVYEELKEFEA